MQPTPMSPHWGKWLNKSMENEAAIETFQCWVQSLCSQMDAAPLPTLSCATQHKDIIPKSSGWERRQNCEFTLETLDNYTLSTQRRSAPREGHSSLDLLWLEWHLIPPDFFAETFNPGKNQEGKQRDRGGVVYKIPNHCSSKLQSSSMSEKGPIGL